MCPSFKNVKFVICEAAVAIQMQRFVEGICEDARKDIALTVNLSGVDLVE